MKKFFVVIFTISVSLIVSAPFSVKLKANDIQFNRIEFHVESNEIRYFNNDEVVYSYYATSPIDKNENVKRMIEIQQNRSFFPLEFLISSNVLLFVSQVNYSAVEKQVELILFNSPKGPFKIGTALTVKTGSTLATVDDRLVNLDVAPYMSSPPYAHAYFPIRFIFEAFACKVDWDEDRRVVIVHLPQY